MLYESTRGAGPVSAAQAVLMGLSRDGGLWTPQTLPLVDRQRLKQWMNLPYHELAYEILCPFLEEFAGLRDSLEGAYHPGRFEACGPAPVSALGEDTYLLELYHGPTLAFKDLALQLLPRLMVEASEVTSQQEGVLVLAATSGDTGKAALEGFADVKGTRVAVLFPQDGVSPAQRQQMVTQRGDNVWVYGLNGNFDDAQRQVKALQGDERFQDILKARGWRVSSANSMNVGRLLPQIVYYFYAYGRLTARGAVTLGDEVDFVVPTGNFGNILAGYYAKQMGLPVGRLICASNANRVLTDFFRQGSYDARRPFYRTTSPSMDILVSSNLERLLYEAAGHDAARVARLMERLSREGAYQVEGPRELFPDFWAGCADDAQTAQAIAKAYEAGKLVDPHTAVALHVLEQYRASGADRRPAVVLSTASPYKFSAAVLKALGRDVPDQDEQAENALEQISAVPAPEAIKSLWRQERLHRAAGSGDEATRALIAWMEEGR